MHGKLYILALSIVAVALLNMREIYFAMILYVVWLFALLICRRITYLFTCLCLMMTVFVYFYFPTFEAEESTVVDYNQKKEIHGKISSQVKRSDDRLEFSLKTDDKTNILLTFYTDDFNDFELDNLHIYAKCRVIAENQTIRLPTNPHQFNYSKFLKQKQIDKHMSIISPEDISCTSTFNFFQYFETRHFLIDKVTKHYTNTASIWIRALVLGDTSGLEDDVIDLFQRWGISHLLAISGLHVGIIVAIVYFILLLSSLFTKSTINLLLLLFLMTYIGLAGGQPSVLRASIMVGIGLFYLKNNQKIPIADIISITFIFLFCLKPYLIFQVGFQLSFAVTFAIILSQKWLSQTSSKFMILFKISFISQIAILPFQIHYFSIFEPLSILLNIVIVPYFTLFVIPIAFLLCITLLLPIMIIKPIVFIFEWVHVKVIDILFLLDNYLYHPFILKALNDYEIIAYFVLLWGLMSALERGINSKVYYYAFGFTTFIIFLAYQPYLSPYGKLTMLDIGQGDAMVLELPYRKGVFMIDVGGMPSFTSGEEDKRTYQQIIKPFLYGEGITQIDGVFLSHDDYDHYGSLIHLIEDYPIDHVFVSEFFDQSLIKKDNIPFAVLMPNQIIKVGDYYFTVLHPSKDMGNENDNSLVFKVTLGPLNWLFTGDISKENEKQIVESQLFSQINALKIAHHGSDTSTSDELLKNVSDLAIIPVGRNNRYGHPSRDVIERLNDHKLDIYRTDEDGAIQYIFQEENYMIKIFQ